MSLKTSPRAVPALILSVGSAGSCSIQIPVGRLDHWAGGFSIGAAGKLAKTVEKCDRAGRRELVTAPSFRPACYSCAVEVSVGGLQRLTGQGAPSDSPPANWWSIVSEPPGVILDCAMEGAIPEVVP